LLLNRLFNEDVPAETEQQAEWWSAFASGNGVDLKRGAPALAPALAVAIKVEDDDDFDFSSDDDDGSHDDNCLGYNDFNRRY
jgi:hypothetical protein